MRRYLPLLISGLVACAGPRPSAPPAVALNTADSALKTALQQAKTARVDYRIGSEDVLQIAIFQQEELARTVRVTQNGTVTLPLVGHVKVGGLTVNDAVAEVASKLKEYVINPQVSMLIKEYGSRKIMILGEVGKPGSYEMPPEAKLTVLGAISLAGGFTQVAAPDRTRVIRDSEGKSQIIDVEISAITKRGEKQKDISVEPNDVIYVPQSLF